MLPYYAVVFISTVIVSVLFTRFTRDHAVRQGWLDRPTAGRHLHAAPVPRLGGVAIFLTFAAATGIALIASKLLRVNPPLSIHTALGMALPACLIFVLGLCDDRFSLGPFLKFGVQTIAAVWLYSNGLGIHWLALYGHGALRIWVGLPLTIFWVLLITNAFNLIDGLDGLSAGSALFSTIIILAVSLFRHTPLISLLSVVLAAAILGFLRYNFFPASIFLGDSGSLFIGFLLSALALEGSQKATTTVAVAIPVVAFGLPLLDVCLSVVRRFMNCKPLFLGDYDHIHHKLIKRGFSHRDAVLVLYAVAAAFGLLSLTLLHGEKMIGFVLLLVGLGVWLGIQQLKYVEVFELVATARKIWRGKRIVANNLQVRRAIESLPGTAQDFGEICRILQASLEGVGFCGISVSFPQIDWMEQSSLFPLRPDEKGRWSHFWAEMDLSAPQWELKLELTSSSGAKLGDLYLFRERASGALPLDVSLLGNEFREVVSGAIDRTVRGVAAATPAHPMLAQPKSESALAMNAERASS